MSPADRFTAALLAQLGKPYVWGDEGPAGFDCSGLHWYGLRAAGIPWPRVTADDFKNKARPNISVLEVGDPVFFVGKSGKAYHVASITRVDPGGLEGWTVEARGRRWGVVEYRTDDPANGVRARGGKFYRYPGVDLGELEELEMNVQQDELLKLNRISSIARSWGERILEAMLTGNAGQVPALKTQRDRELENERIRLGLRKDQVSNL